MISKKFLMIEKKCKSSRRTEKKNTTNEISFRIIKTNWFLDLLSLGLEKKVTDSKGSEYEWVSLKTLLRHKINVKLSK